MNHPYWKALWIIGFVVSITSGIVSIIEKSQHADPTVLWGVAGIALALVFVGLLLDYRPWRWSIFRGTNAAQTKDARR